MSIYFNLIYAASFLGIFLTVFYTLNLIIDSKKKKKLNSEIFPVSIVIPAYNEEPSIGLTLKSLLAMNYPKDKLEIIVVDDGSKDNTYKVAKKFESSSWPKVRVFTKPNGGKGSAVNLGIRKSMGKIVATMDADSIVTPDALRRIVMHFNKKEVMAVTPSMAVYKPRSFLQRIQQIEYALGIFLRKAFSTIDAVHITPGALSVYRKEFFVKHGYFDETTITEDLEIALRIQSLHYKIANCPEAVVYTISPSKFKELLIQRKRWYSGLIKHLTGQYKHMFGVEHGILGVLVLPVAIVTIFSTIFLTAYTLARSVSSLRDEIISLSAVNFDFGNFFEFSKFAVQHFVSSVLSQPIFLMFLVFCTFLFFIILFAKKKSQFKDSFGLSLLFFIFTFSILFSFWWVVTFFYVISGKKIIWRESKQHHG